MTHFGKQKDGATTYIKMDKIYFSGWTPYTLKLMEGSEEGIYLKMNG